MQINHYHGDLCCQLVHFLAQLAQLALLGCTAQILLIPVCHVQLIQTKLELLFHLAPALQDTSELQRMVQRLHVLVSWIAVCLVQMCKS